MINHSIKIRVFTCILRGDKTNTNVVVGIKIYVTGWYVNIGSPIFKMNSLCYTPGSVLVIVLLFEVHGGTFL